MNFLKFYEGIIESELRETMAQNMAFEELENQIKSAILANKDFCYETNFNHTPLHWPKLFKDNGYELRMVFFSLNSIEEAKRRVAIRVQNGGHFVPDYEIEKRYYEGFYNLNLNYKFFDSIDLFDTSVYGSEPSYVFSIENGQLILPKTLPTYLEKLLPDILV